MLLRPFLQANDPRAATICSRVMALTNGEVRTLWKQVQAEFADRHAKTREFLRRRFEQVRHNLPADAVTMHAEHWFRLYLHPTKPPPPPPKPAANLKDSSKRTEINKGEHKDVIGADK